MLSTSVDDLRDRVSIVADDEHIGLQLGTVAEQQLCRDVVERPDDACCPAAAAAPAARHYRPRTGSAKGPRSSNPRGFTQSTTMRPSSSLAQAC